MDPNLLGTTARSSRSSNCIAAAAPACWSRHRCRSWCIVQRCSCRNSTTASASGTANRNASCIASTWIKRIGNQLWNHLADLNLNFLGRWNLNAHYVFLNNILSNGFGTSCLERFNRLGWDMHGEGNFLGLLLGPVRNNWIRFLLGLNCGPQNSPSSCSLFFCIIDDFTSTSSWLGIVGFLNVANHRHFDCVVFRDFVPDRNTNRDVYRLSGLFWDQNIVFNCLGFRSWDHGHLGGEIFDCHRNGLGNLLDACSCFLFCFHRSHVISTFCP